MFCLLSWPHPCLRELVAVPARDLPDNHSPYALLQEPVPAGVGPGMAAYGTQPGPLPQQYPGEANHVGDSAGTGEFLELCEVLLEYSRVVLVLLSGRRLPCMFCDYWNILTALSS